MANEYRYALYTNGDRFYGETFAASPVQALRKVTGAHCDFRKVRLLVGDFTVYRIGVQIDINDVYPHTQHNINTLTHSHKKIIHIGEYNRV